MAKPAKEQRRNGFDDDDLAQVVERIDAAKETEREEKQAASDKRKRAIKIIEAEAKNVGIPLASLRRLIKVRDLQTKLKAEVGKLPEDELEVFSDMEGQLSFLRPVSVLETPGMVAVRLRQAEIAAVTEAEQAEGEKALAELAGGTLN
jgi:hypothetical protein